MFRKIENLFSTVSTQIAQTKIESINEAEIKKQILTDKFKIF